MLPLKHRLRKTRDFQRIYQRGHPISLPTLVFRCLRRDHGPSRFGIVVSNKVFKTSVERNRIRRQLRSILFQELPRLSRGFDCILTVRPSIKEKKFKEISEDVQQLLQKANLL